MGPLRRVAVLLALTAIALGAGLFPAPGAAAGGPTSVLIVAPESGEATGLYGSSAEYRRLSSLLDDGAVTAGADRPPGLDRVTGVRRINMAWMLHDITPWRLDRVYPSEDGRSVWIHTARGLPESFAGSWHRAAEPRELTALLRKLGVAGERGVGQGGLAVPPGPPWEDGGTAAPRSGEAPAARLGGTGDWWWAIPVLAAGAVLGAALRPPAARLPHRGGLGASGDRDRGPRQQLLDP
ncbi:hypothetical protein [Streptomyces wuyuanensis]|uniref:hypothetical protein n=1 Tax=Streptomyces wuyuanensis TaxID=1196353 RepID=UPI00380E8D59